MSRFLALFVLPFFIVAFSIPVSAAPVGSTTAPVLDASLNWELFASDGENVTIQTDIVAGRIYHGTYTNGLDLAYTAVSYNGRLLTKIGNNLINSVQLGLSVTSSTYQSGLVYDSRFDLDVRSEASFLIGDNGGVPVYYSITAPVSYAFGSVDQNLNEFSASSTSLSLNTDSFVSIPSQGDGFTALYIRYDLTDVPLEDLDGSDSLEIVSTWKIRLTGPRDLIEPYLNGGETIFSGLDIDNAISNYTPDLDFTVDIEGPAVDFVVSTIEVARGIPWISSMLVISATWVVIALVLWRRQ